MREISSCFNISFKNNLCFFIYFLDIFVSGAKQKLYHLPIQKPSTIILFLVRDS